MDVQIRGFFQFTLRPVDVNPNSHKLFDVLPSTLYTYDAFYTHLTVSR